MTTLDDGLSNAEFERRLLASARDDAFPGDAPRAWTRLASAISLAAGSNAANPMPPKGGRELRAMAKWLLVGAIVGSAATALITAARRRPADEPTPATSSPSAAPTAPSGEAGGAVTIAPPAEAAPGDPGTRAKVSDRRRRALEPSPGHSNPRSTLAEEVSRIDTARTAIGLADFDAAVRLIDSYHRDFPRGALTPEAHVVAIEAVAAKRDSVELARRAEIFLSRYPSDPHAARVKWLATHREGDR